MSETGQLVYYLQFDSGINALLLKASCLKSSCIPSGVGSLKSFRNGTLVYWISFLIPVCWFLVGPRWHNNVLCTIFLWKRKTSLWESYGRLEMELFNFNEKVQIPKRNYVFIYITLRPRSSLPKKIFYSQFHLFFCSLFTKWIFSNHCYWEWKDGDIFSLSCYHYSE